MFYSTQIELECRVWLGVVDDQTDVSEMITK